MNAAVSYTHLSFINHNLKYHPARLFFQYGDMGRTGLFAVDFHTGGQTDHLCIADFRAHGDAVGFGNMVAWVHDKVSKFAVVGEQQQAFTVLVQSADGVHPLRRCV